MKTRYFFLMVALAFLCPSAFAQSVVVTGKKTTYTRKSPMSDDKKTFWINHPKVKAATPALSRKIESAISFEKVLSVNVNKEINEVQWLEEADFSVGYNDNGILVVSLTIYGSAAYPSTSTKIVAINTRTGSLIKPSEMFVNLSGLASMVRKAQKKEIAEAIVEIRSDPGHEEPDPETLFTETNFTVADLDEFSIDGEGVKFHYDYGFPHVIQALQPLGDYHFTWLQLKPFIKQGGLLARIAR